MKAAAWVTCGVIVSALALLPGGGRATATPTAVQPERPRLLVVLVVDQMRYDYLERYGHAWTEGLKQLVSGGARFDQASYPYLNTVTCAGHATIATGALPYKHGIILNEWYRRPDGRRMPCTEDRSVASIPYAGPAEPLGHSARRLRVPTLGDRLRAASPSSRIVTMSMKPRSTVMLAGQGGTAVTWFADSGTWGTSTAYTATPVPAVQAFVAANPVEHERSTVWTRARPAGAYTGRDDDPAERPRPGWRASFPHPLTGAPGTAPDQFVEFWERSPYSDAYLGRMAAALVSAYDLGRRDTVDFLGISFSGLDYVGHDFGPDSHEVQDTLFRLDRTIGALLDHLDRAVGRDAYVLALTADHGVAEIPEARRARGLLGGRVLNAQVRKVAEDAMTAAHGPGPHVAHVEYTNLYLSDAARARAAKDPGYLSPLLEAVSRLDGVLRVFPARGLERLRDSEDPIERAAALSHHPAESGEVVVVLERDWIGTDTSAATHGSAQAYDQHVPLIFYGAGIRPGRYATAASPADIAPTLAALVSLALPDADGRVLTAAVR